MDEQLCEWLKIALQNKDVLQNTEGSSKLNSDTKKKPTPEQAAEALALMIDQLPEIKRYLDKIYLPYYEEALTKYTQPDVIKNLHRFQEKYQLNIEDINCQDRDSNQLLRKQFLNWIMTIFKLDCIDIYRQYNPKKAKKDDNNENKLKSRKPAIKLISLAETIGNNPQGITLEETIPDGSNSRKGYVVKLSGLDLLLQDELQYFARQLKHQIEEDPENRFRNCHIKNRQDGNCQTLIGLRYLKEPALKLREISETLKIKRSTINNHMDKKCKPLLKQIAEELGYE